MSEKTFGEREGWMEGHTAAELREAIAVSRKSELSMDEVLSCNDSAASCEMISDLLDYIDELEKR